jgi:RecA/RadA recombinase
MLIAYGPSQSGKTALLSQIAGNILNDNGEVYFNDPEARLDQEFSSMFGMHLDEENYSTPNTITEVFKNLREWKPKDTSTINGVFTDSLAALSTDMEMGSDEGDKMGGRRGKEFSEALRKHARIIKSNNYIFACSNQIREKMNAMAFESKVEFPGGKALWFYSSVVMRFNNPQKVKTKAKINGKDEFRITGIEVEVIVEKTVDTPYRKAPLIITFGYGIDNIRTNLEFVKKYKKLTTYCVKGVSVGVGLEKAIVCVEKNNLERKLENETIDLWEEIEKMFVVERKKKVR